MNNIEKCAQGDYQFNKEYRVIYNGAKYKGILIAIGTEEECSFRANKLMIPKDSNKIIQDLNKNGIQFCKNQLLETEIDEMLIKLKERDEKITEQEKSFNELSNKCVGESPRGLKCTDEECFIERINPHNIKQFADKSVQVNNKGSRLQSKLLVLETHINETSRIMKEKDNRIKELEKSVDELNKKIKQNILGSLKRERGK